MTNPSGFLLYAGLLLILNSTVAIASEQVFVREYSYQASDLDSKVSARNNTLKLIKAGVLEEIISFVHNTSDMKQVQSGDEFKSSFIQRTSSASAGFVKARILEEQWNGFEMTIKAEIRADPESIRRELEQSLTRKPAAPAGPVKSAPQPEPAAPPPVQARQAPQRYPTPMPPAVVAPGMNTNADYSGYMRAARVSEVLVMLTPVKLKLLEYRMMYGDWPKSLEDVRLNAEEMTDGKLIDRVNLAQNGRILAHLSGIFGKDRKLALSPRQVMGGTQTRWQCSTNLNMRQIAAPYLDCAQDKNL